LQAIEQEGQRIQEVMEQLRHLEKPAVMEYVSGVEMIDMHRSIAYPSEEGQGRPGATG
jgi:hypothetical protein